MKIIWLEDEPDTIFVIQTEVKEHCKELIVCQSFSKLSNELEKIKDNSDYLIILDIRIVFYQELEINCFQKKFKITKELEAGMEYYLECLKSKFREDRIIFLSSKTLKNAQEDGRRYHISPQQIIAKEDFTQLITRIKNVQQ